MSAVDPSGFEPEYRHYLEEAKAFILKQDRFLVVSHVNPDGDAAGSTLAVGHMLRQLGKSFAMINEGPVPGKFGLLSGIQQIGNFSEMEPQGLRPAFDCAITVDCADFERIGRVREWLSSETPLLNIDHHPTNDGFGTVPLLQPDAAATAEVLYDLAVVMGIQWEKEVAECIYTGLLTDTGGFRYSNTTPKVLTIASQMLRYGVNGNELADQLLEKLTFSQVAVLKKALATLSYTPDKRIAWMSLTLEDVREAGADNGDTDGLVNYPRNIEGVEVGLLFKQVDDNKYKVSFRSAGKADVAAVAQRFGGGGHVRASGCTVQGSLEQVMEQVIQEVGRAL